MPFWNRKMCMEGGGVKATRILSELKQIFLQDGFPNEAIHLNQSFLLSAPLPLTPSPPPPLSPSPSLSPNTIFTAFCLPPSSGFVGEKVAADIHVLFPEPANIGGSGDGRGILRKLYPSQILDCGCCKGSHKE